MLNKWIYSQTVCVSFICHLSCSLLIMAISARGPWNWSKCHLCILLPTHCHFWSWISNHVRSPLHKQLPALTYRLLSFPLASPEQNLLSGDKIGEHGFIRMSHISPAPLKSTLLFNMISLVLLLELEDAQWTSLIWHPKWWWTFSPL